MLEFVIETQFAASYSTTKSLKNRFIYIFFKLGQYTLIANTPIGLKPLRNYKDHWMLLTTISS